MALPVVLVVAFLVGESGDDAADPSPVTSAAPGPLKTSVPDLDQADAAICGPVLAAMPVTLDAGDGSPALQPLVVTPGGPSLLAWGDPLVTLQCGVGRPAPLTDSSGYVPYVIAPSDSPGATWLVEPGSDRDTWTTVDRAVYFRMTVPHADSGYVTDVSGVIARELAAVCKGPVEVGDPPDTQYCGSRP